MEGSISARLEHAGMMVLEASDTDAVLLRASDQVLLSLAWEHLTVSGDPARLTVNAGADHGLLIVGMGPQHVREQARPPLPDDTPTNPDHPTMLVAHCSRIVLRLDADADPVPFTVEGVLAALARLPENVVPVARTRRRTKALDPFGHLDDLRQTGMGEADERLLRLAADRRLRGRQQFELGRSEAKPRAPKHDETAIELPGRLILSPHATATWSNASATPGAGPVELWHARLSAPNVQAVWQRANTKPKEPVDSLPGEFDREEIVTVTSVGGAHVTPVPIDTRLLALSTLGGWLDSDLQVLQRPAGIALSLWRHLATLGRDQHVKVIAEGFLFPWGHRAAQIEIVDRCFGGGAGNPAGLVYRNYVLVRQPVVEHRLEGIHRVTSEPTVFAAANEWPFVRTEVRTRITPVLSQPKMIPQLLECFEPCVGPGIGTPFQFLMRLHTLDGGHVDTHAPAIFVGDYGRDSESQLASPIAGTKLAKVWATQSVFLGGRRIPLAAPGGSAGTSLGVERMEVGATVLRDDDYTHLRASTGEVDDPDHPIGCWLPRIVEARVLPAVVRHFTANASPVSMRYQDTYLRFGFATDHNPGGVFLETLPGVGTSTKNEPAFAFNKGADRTGGMVQPSFSMAGLSRESGPVGAAAGLQAIAGGDFDPASFFDGMTPLIFGVVPLTKLLSAVGRPPAFVADIATRIEALITGLQAAEEGAAAQVDAVRAQVEAVIGGGDTAALVAALTALDQALGVPDTPALTALHALLADPASVAAGLGIPHEAKLAFDWQPGLTTYPPFFPHAIDDPDTAATLDIHVEGTAPTSGGEPAFSLRTTLRNATLKLLEEDGPLGFIEIGFEKLEFSTVAGKHPDVVCDLAGVKFVGVLSFVEALKRLIPLNGFSDPPALTVDASGVKADFSLALPDIAFGVFSLQNMALSAGFTVPFIANPMTARFGFCSKESPALLTVSGLGGGGYLSIVVDPKQVEVLEAGFDFGASLTVNFGVASGEVHVLGGFIYAMVSGQASLTGFLRIGGSVEVIGLIHASIELSLSLTYEPGSGKCTGEADLAIEVSIAFFSTTVHLHCERRFAGSDGDPPFIEAWQPDSDGTDLWAEYQGAFA